MSMQSKEEFHKIYKEKFEPLLLELEPEREVLFKKYMTLLTIILICIGLLSVSGMLAPFIFLPIFVFMIILSVPLTQCYKCWRKKVKKNIISKLLTLYGNFYYSENKNSIALKAIQHFGLYDECRTKEDDDIIIGLYNGSNLVINECRIGEKHKLFVGLLVKIQMKKNFTGTTVFGPQMYIKQMDGTEPVELESVDFMKGMHVYSTNQVEARYILTPGFMEKLQELGYVFNSKLYNGKNLEQYNNQYTSNLVLKFLPRISAIFHEGYAYLFIPTLNDFFEIPFHQTLLNENNYYHIFNEMSLILEIIDYLNIDKNQGL